ncbi:MAG: NAD(P)-dependent oxidoreductase [Candidatus Micrarchaeota archaeon]
MKTNPALQSPPRLGQKVAIYGAPRIVAKRLSDLLQNQGCTVLYDGPLNKDTACEEADIWIMKWSFIESDAFLREHHPKTGIVSLTAGLDHLRFKAIEELGLKLVNCPTFSSNSVAEHALALAMRGASRSSILPPLSAGRIFITHYSDDKAEPVVAEMLMRSRQLEDSVSRAHNYEYFRPDDPETRHDEPWTNDELADSTVGIIGADRDASRLAGCLTRGFGCEILVEEIPRWVRPSDLAERRVVPASITTILEECDYIFTCARAYDNIRGMPGRISVDSRAMHGLEPSFEGAEIAVIGAGRIGARIAHMARLGFGCAVTAFNRSFNPGLIDIGVRYAKTIDEALRTAAFIFVTLPLNAETRAMIGRDSLGGMKAGSPRVMVNVARDGICESDAIFDEVSRGGVMTFATDVAPSEYLFMRNGVPDDMMRKFNQHSSITITPHEGDCSKRSLERMCGEVMRAIENILR